MTLGRRDQLSTTAVVSASLSVSRESLDVDMKVEREDRSCVGVICEVNDTARRKKDVPSLLLTKAVHNALVSAPATSTIQNFESKLFRSIRVIEVVVKATRTLLPM